MATLTLAKALNTALREAMDADNKVLVMGEDVGRLGGVFRITDGLQKDFGEHRVMDTPLAESGIVGTALGLAMRGYRPVVEIQFDGFVFPAFDQIISQVAKVGLPDRRFVPGVDGDPDPVRRRDRRCRAPFGVTGVVLLPHRRAAGGRVFQPVGRLPHAARGDRLRRPGDLPGTQAPVLGEGRGGHRVAPGRLLQPRVWSALERTAPWSPTGRRCPSRWPPPRWPPARVDRWRSSTCVRCRRWTSTRCWTRCVGPAISWSSRKRPGSRRSPRARRPGVGRGVLLAGGSGGRVAGFDTPVPAEQARGGVPAEPGPHPGGGRSLPGGLVKRVVRSVSSGVGCRS